MATEDDEHTKINRISASQARLLRERLRDILSDFRVDLYSSDPVEEIVVEAAYEVAQADAEMVMSEMLYPDGKEEEEGSDDGEEGEPRSVPAS